MVERLVKGTLLAVFLWTSEVFPVWAQDFVMTPANVKGKATVYRGDKTIEVKDDSFFFQVKDRILTDSGSKMDVVANDRWAFRMLGDSEATILDVSDSHTQIDIARGNFLFNVKGSEQTEQNRIEEKAGLYHKASFEVSTPTAIAGVRGTQFWGQVTPNSTLQSGTFAVKEGHVDVYVKTLEITVPLIKGLALDVPKGFSIPNARGATDQEKKSMQEIEQIPLSVVKNHLDKKLQFLKSITEKAKNASSQEASKETKDAPAKSSEKDAPGNSPR